MANGISLCTIACCVLQLVIASRTAHLPSKNSISGSLVSQDEATIIMESANASPSTRFEQDCQNKLTSFAYKENLCGAPNQEVFWETAKAQYTCTNRCSYAATYGKLHECSCDNVCIIYNDCCDDFADICPENYSRGKIFYSHLNGATIDCGDSSFTVIYNRNSEHVSTTPASSTIAQAATLDLYSKDRSLPYPPRTLNQFFTTFAMFKIIDFEFGVIFNNYNAFNKWRAPEMKPTFIPKISVFDCTGSYLKTLVLSKLREVIQWCHFLKVTDAKTPLYRNCPQLMTVACKCRMGDGITKLLGDHRTGSCVGEKNVMSLFSRHERVQEGINSLKPAAFANKFSKGEECNQQNFFVSSSDDSDVTFDPETSIKMTISPKFLSSFTHTNQDEKSNTSKRHDQIDEEDPDQNAGNTVNDFFEKHSIEFVVELSQTVERRFRCRSLTNFLSDCHLEECVTGALVWTHPPGQVGWQFQNAECFLPVGATVMAADHTSVKSICTCMRILVALSLLKIWKVKFDTLEADKCLFRLQALQEDTQRGDDPMFDGDPRVYHFSASSKETERRLQSLFLHRPDFYCPGENMYGLRLCFFDHEADFKTTNCSMYMKLYEGVQDLNFGGLATFAEATPTFVTSCVLIVPLLVIQ